MCDYGLGQPAFRIFHTAKLLPLVSPPIEKTSVLQVSLLRYIVHGEPIQNTTMQLFANDICYMHESIEAAFDHIMLLY